MPGSAEGAVSCGAVSLWEPRFAPAAASFQLSVSARFPALCLHTLPVPASRRKNPETSEPGAFPVAVTVLGPEG